VEKRKTIDMKDLEADALLVWQKNFYLLLFPLIVIAFPTAVAVHFWNEDPWIAFWTVFVCRFVTVLNIAFSVNSVSHMFGSKPYDKHIMSVENVSVSIAAMGEGWHNYHHVSRENSRTKNLL
jgi:stearoyl-CoA desaturase (delta-9 desaturase)